MRKTIAAAVTAALGITVAVGVMAHSSPPAGASGPIAPCSPGNVMRGVNNALAPSIKTLARLPGVTVRRLHKAGHTDVDVVTANLRRTHLSPRTAPTVSQRTTVIKQIAPTRALVATNGDFFDWGRTNAAMGIEVKGPGTVVKGFAHPGHKSLIYDWTHRSARVDWASLNIVVHHGTRFVHALQLNGGTSIPTNGVGVYTPVWGSTPLTLLKRAGSLHEYFISHNGYVTQVLPYLSKTPIPRGGKVLLTHGTGGTQLYNAGVRRGAKIWVTWNRVQPGVYSAIGVKTDLIRQWTSGDRYETHLGCKSDPAVARQIVGVTRDKHTLFLVTVHGRADGAVRGAGGMTVQQSQGLMWRLGAYQAAMLDGGGSSVLWVRYGGRWHLIWAPAGQTRPVPNSNVLYGG